MKVVVYVEGKSDVLAMQALLHELIEAKKRDGVLITFHEIAIGDRKKSLLIRAPKNAVNILRGNPDDIVAIIPDLYPPGIAFPHRTFDELRDGVMRAFGDAVREKGLDEEAYIQRFHVFCFKHDLEALVLAAEESLARRLGKTFRDRWSRPVEDQNHDVPPKYIVRQLYEECEKYYGTDEAALVLAGADYEDIAERCPQCFMPFIEFLTSLRPVA